jgi:hypothetical protein
LGSATSRPPPERAGELLAGAMRELNGRSAGGNGYEVTR